MKVLEFVKNKFKTVDVSAVRCLWSNRFTWIDSYRVRSSNPVLTRNQSWYSRSVAIFIEHSAVRHVITQNISRVSSKSPLSVTLNTWTHVGNHSASSLFKCSKPDQTGRSLIRWTGCCRSHRLNIPWARSFNSRKNGLVIGFGMIGRSVADALKSNNYVVSVYDT